MNLNKKIILSVVAGVFITFSSFGFFLGTAYAVECNDGTQIPTPEIKDDNQTNYCSSHGGFDGTTKTEDNKNAQKIYDRLADAINILSGLVGVIVVISVILGGIQYTTAGGDPQKVAAAKKRILSAVVALFAFIFLYAFLQYLVPGGVF